MRMLNVKRKTTSLVASISLTLIGSVLIEVILVAVYLTELAAHSWIMTATGLPYCSLIIQSSYWSVMMLIYSISKRSLSASPYRILVSVIPVFCGGIGTLHGYIYAYRLYSTIGGIPHQKKYFEDMAACLSTLFVGVIVSVLLIVASLIMYLFDNDTSDLN
ncbi:MAG: hypothetical protein KatS3mg111_0475 [Pirellulaceae bacterium]|nr:MAG: hypothetical protein KatS3mg111_0475 [Pirellulaceae bacterium]